MSVVSHPLGKKPLSETLLELLSGLMFSLRKKIFKGGNVLFFESEPKVNQSHALWIRSKLKLRNKILHQKRNVPIIPRGWFFTWPFNWILVSLLKISFFCFWSYLVSLHATLGESNKFLIMVLVKPSIFYLLFFKMDHFSAPTSVYPF